MAWVAQVSCLNVPICCPFDVVQGVPLGKLYLFAVLFLWAEPGDPSSGWYAMHEVPTLSDFTVRRQFAVAVPVSGEYMHCSDCSPLPCGHAGWGSESPAVLVVTLPAWGQICTPLWGAVLWLPNWVSTVILERNSALLCTAPSLGLFLGGVIASWEGTVAGQIISATVH